jgi:hypothetical protein
MITPEVSEVLHYCYEVGGFTTRSDYARQYAEAIAAAACQGFITTEVPREGFGSIWRPTPLGLDALFINGGTPSHLYVHGQLPEVSIQ